MGNMAHLLTEPSVLVVGILLASALLPDSLQAVIRPILLLLHSCSLILQQNSALSFTKKRIVILERFVSISEASWKQHQ